MNYLKIKYKLDKIIAFLLIVVLAPLLLIVGIMIKIESKGPIIFKQKRLGENGAEFWIYKFRSMSLDAESQGVYEKKKDTRVTKVGVFIRKTSIDELPQLFNILKGDMSVIGPRPTLTYHPWPIDEYTSEQRKRFLVKPGVTGLAQINGRKQIEWTERIQYDVNYSQNVSIVLDSLIFIKTLKKVLMMEDNYNSKETVIKK